MIALQRTNTISNAISTCIQSINTNQDPHTILKQKNIHTRQASQYQASYNQMQMKR